jgi:hypothetical protein
MPELSEKELLTRIHKSLDEIKSVLVLTNQDKLTEIKKSMLKEGSVKIQVYNLCDGSKTTQDIAQAIQKSVEYTNSYLSILRREGFIRTVEKEGKQVHEQVF